MSGCGRRSLPVAVLNFLPTQDLRDRRGLYPNLPRPRWGAATFASADDVGGVEGLDRGVVEAGFTQDLVGVFTEGGR